MTSDVRSRIGSVSKLWTSTVVVKLAEEGKLRLGDTVERWLPGVFPYGSRVTIRELLNHTSGMIDDNDITARPRYWLARIRDPRVRAKLLALGKATQRNPAATISPQLEVRVAAALPLLFQPGKRLPLLEHRLQDGGADRREGGPGAARATLYHRDHRRPAEAAQRRLRPERRRSRGPTRSATSIGPGGKAEAERGRRRGERGRVGRHRQSAPRTRRASSSRSSRGRIVSGALPARRSRLRPRSGRYGLGTAVQHDLRRIRVLLHNGGARHLLHGGGRASPATASASSSCS